MKKPRKISPRFVTKYRNLAYELDFQGHRYESLNESVGITLKKVAKLLDEMIKKLEVN